MRPIDPDSLDEQMRSAMREPELPDEGFTARVLCALPRRSSLWSPPQLLLALVWTCALAGLGLALLMLASSEEASTRAAQMGESAAAFLANPWTAFAAAMAVGSYTYALFAARAAARR